MRKFLRIPANFRGFSAIRRTFFSLLFFQIFYRPIINDYVSSAEEYMAAFALSGEVRELLLNPDDPALLKRAQQYTEDFAAVKGIFEGLYIATPETYVLTHTSQGAIGITTRGFPYSAARRPRGRGIRRFPHSKIRIRCPAGP